MCIPSLQTLFNTCLRLGETPLTWGKAIIKPIPKTRVPSKKPSEYRGISLQSVIVKTYCRILNYRLHNWIEFNNILNEEQNGFCPGRNCQDHIFVLTSIIDRGGAGISKVVRPLQIKLFVESKCVGADAVRSGCARLLIHRCQVNIGIPKYRHPRCLYSRKNRHPDAYIYVNVGIRVPIFTVNMGIPL